LDNEVFDIIDARCNHEDWRFIDCIILSFLFICL